MKTAGKNSTWIYLTSAILLGVANLAFAAPASPPQKGLEEGVRFEQKLRRYGWLEKKVFPSDDEKLERSALVADADLLKSLGRLLERPSVTGSPRELMQNYAVDLLMESLSQNSANGAASSATLASLQEVVKNPDIEHNHGWFDEHARKSVAGFKGEILYRWSSAQPDQAQVIAALLPGPLSQKIWANVQLMENENSHLSEATVAAKTSKSHSKN